MNKYTFLFIVTFLLLSATPSLAVSDTSINQRDRDQVQSQTNQDLSNLPQDITPSQVRIRQQTENQGEETQIQVRQEVQSRLTQVKQNLVNRVYGNIQKQLTKRYQVLMASEAKIQARIQNLVSEGKNLTPASDKLAESEAFKLQYQAALGELANQVNAIHQSTEPFNQVPALRQTSQKIGNILKQIRQVQVEAIRLIINLND
jgi:methionyl-tRNA synthetase